jgi:predicted molibdopterin-dependent oxidoreductase YjgC
MTQWNAQQKQALLEKRIRELRKALTTIKNRNGDWTIDQTVAERAIKVDDKQ